MLLTSLSSIPPDWFDPVLHLATQVGSREQCHRERLHPDGPCLQRREKLHPQYRQEDQGIWVQRAPHPEEHSQGRRDGARSALSGEKVFVDTRFLSEIMESCR